jgi:hypothetical protein
MSMDGRYQGNAGAIADDAEASLAKNGCNKLRYYVNSTA